MKQQTRSLFETEYRNRETLAWGLSGEQLFDEMNRAHPSTCAAQAITQNLAFKSLIQRGRQ
jgi:hypothetical protein